MKLNPTCVKAYVARADIYIFLKQYRLAVNDFKEALKLDPCNHNIGMEMDRAQHLLTKELDGEFIDYYETLGVEKNDTDEIIKKRYKVLALKYHPDKFNGTDEEKLEGEKIMREVNLAWATFKDKEKRKEYD